MMKKLLTVMLLFFFGFGVGKGVAAIVLPDSSGKDEDESLLWKVTGNGLEEPSYIFGTIHLMCENQFSFPDQLTELIKASDRVVLELDMDDPQMMSKMQQLSINPGMKNIKEYLKEDEIKLLDDFFKTNFNAGIDQMGVLKPFVIQSMMYVGLSECPIKSYEMEIVAAAQQAQLEVLGLETIEFQMSIFDNIDQEEQIEWLIKYLNDQDSFTEEFSQMVDLYKKQKLSKLVNMINDSPEYQDHAAVLLDNRNENWIEKLEEYFMEGSSFIAVGAGHLGSEKGVIELLREEGYTVDPVKLVF